MSDTLYTIESIETSGPVTEELTLNDAVVKLNNEKANNRFIFIDGKPITDDVITATMVETCKNTISVVNQLIGG